jgi:hypothetical protein
MFLFCSRADCGHQQQEDAMTEMDDGAERAAAEVVAFPAGGALPERSGPPNVQLPFCATDLMASRDVTFAECLGEQMMECLGLKAEMGEAQMARRAAAALGAVREIGPRSGTEAMVAANMVAAHAAGLERLARAMREPRVGKAESLTRQSVRMMNAFTRQLESLQRLRGQERESIRVEHERRTADGRTSVTAEKERVR